jgi:hypothetical protein
MLYSWRIKLALRSSPAGSYTHTLTHTHTHTNTVHTCGAPRSIRGLVCVCVCLCICVYWRAHKHEYTQIHMNARAHTHTLLPLTFCQPTASSYRPRTALLEAPQPRHIFFIYIYIYIYIYILVLIDAFICYVLYLFICCFTRRKLLYPH